MGKFATQQARLLGDRYAPVAIPGLISAYRFREGYSAEELEPQEVAAALEAEDGWLWLHFALTDKLARNFIADLDRLPEPARAALIDTEEQLSIDATEDAVFRIVADFEHEIDRSTEAVGRLRFALTERLVISGRRHPVRSVEEIRQALHEGRTFTAAGALIEAIMDRLCDAVARACAGMADTLDQIEDRVVSDLVERERARLMPVRRLAVRLHRQLGSLAAILRHWEEREDEGAKPSLRIASARLAARLESLDQDVLGLQDRARLLQDEIAARLAEETNASLKVLSRLTALLLPGSLVSGIFGMNVHGLPFLESTHGFLVVMVMGAAATAAFYILLRRTGA